MIYRQLLQDNIYRAEMMKVLEAEKVQVLISKKTCNTQVLKAYIKLKGILLLVLLDIRVLVLVISKDLAQKLQLKIKANDNIRVSSLERNPKVRVVGLIKEAPLS